MTAVHNARVSGRITFVIPTRNNERTIAACVASAHNQTGDVEVVVVDNHSSDATAELARSHGADHVLIGGPERSAQRNRGFGISTGEFVVFIDSDMVVDDGVACDLRTLFAASDLGAAVLPETSFGVGHLARCRALEKRLYLGRASAEAARAFRASVFEAVSGYDEDNCGFEDYDLADRVRDAGWPSGRSPRGVRHDEGRVNLRSLWNKKRYYGSHWPSYAATRSGHGRLRRFPLRPGLLAADAHHVPGLVLLKLVDLSGLLVGRLIGTSANGADGEKRSHRPAGPAGVTSEHNRPRVLLLSWHAEEGPISAGGYRRTVEMVRRFEAWGEFTVVDTQPAMFSVAPPSLVVPYRLPELGWLVRIDRRLARLAQWPWATLSMIRRGRRACRGGVDVIYVPSSELLPCVLAGVALSRVYRRRLVLCNMNADDHALGRLVVALHNLAHEVVALSPGLADALVRRGLRRRPHVIGCGSPVQEEPPAGERPPKEWDAVFIGRHTKGKGIPDLLDIWELVRQRHPQARLALIGSCSEEMARLIDTRCDGRSLLRGAVVRLGILSEPEKNSILAASRVLLFPSRIEGWGFVPQEALVRSVPVVCWDLPAYEASLPRHPSVVRIATGDAEGFASAALDLLALDDDTRSDLAAAAPMTMSSWDDVAEQEWSVLCAPGDRL